MQIKNEYKYTYIPSDDCGIDSVLLTINDTTLFTCGRSSFIADGPLCLELGTG